MSVLKCLLAGVMVLGSACTSIPVQDGPIQTTSGMLSGTESDGVAIFKGVPFVAQPVGDLRWAAPEPSKWDGVLVADAFGPACPQPVNKNGSPNFGGYAGPVDEACLTMNIWAPADANNAPVMLWLFGGGGVVGAGNVPTYDGTSFAKNGVILVTINYRLGALGGFAHPVLTAAADPGEASSNFHLLDAISALNWIRDNAGAFGGDSENVTVFGESAGATMVANLLTSPAAQGAFDKAIIESTGSLKTPGTPLEKAEALGSKLTRDLGLSEAEATPEALRELEVSGILSNKSYGRGSRTIIDGVVRTASIIDVFEAGQEIDVPFIIGTNSDEGRLVGTQAIAGHAEDGEPVWQYFFDYVPEVLREDNPNGAPHAGEIPFVFNTLSRHPLIADQASDADQKVADFVHSCWVAFAKLPKGQRSLTCDNGFVWPSRTDQNDHSVAVLSDSPELIQAGDVKSPPNGAAPGRTSRDEES